MKKWACIFLGDSAGVIVMGDHVLVRLLLIHIKPPLSVINTKTMWFISAADYKTTYLQSNQGMNFLRVINLKGIIQLKMKNMSSFTHGVFSSFCWTQKEMVSRMKAWSFLNIYDSNLSLKHQITCINAFALLLCLLSLLELESPFIMINSSMNIIFLCLKWHQGW